MNVGAVISGLVVGVVVGMTGSGGAALLTPLLILVLSINAKTAVASDLVASVFMRPVAGFVHLRRSMVNWSLVGWLALGSVPTAFAAGIISTALVPADRADAILEPVIGGVLLFSGAAAVARRLLAARRRRLGVARPEPTGERPRPLVTVLIGVVGGIAVGVTSVGSGTLMLVGLALVYPGLSSYELVGTDLVQAVPLVLAAAIGHLALGGLHIPLTGAVIVGGVPGAALGAYCTRFTPPGTLTAIVAAVIFGSGCALIGWVPGSIVGGVALVACAVGVVLAVRRPAGPIAGGPPSDVHSAGSPPPSSSPSGAPARP